MDYAKYTDNYFILSIMQVIYLLVNIILVYAEPTILILFSWLFEFY